MAALWRCNLVDPPWRIGDLTVDELIDLDEYLGDEGPWWAINPTNPVVAKKLAVYVLTRRNDVSEDEALKDVAARKGVDLVVSFGPDEVDPPKADEGS